MPVHSVANVKEFSSSKKELLTRLADVACQLQTKEATHQNINVWLYRGLAALEDDGDAAMSMLAEANAWKLQPPWYKTAPQNRPLALGIYAAAPLDAS